jgi:HprK-related kinase B
MPDAHRSIADWVADLRGKYPPIRSFDLAIEGCPIRVDSNSPELVARLNRYYEDYVAAEQRPPHVHVTLLNAPAPETPLEFAIYPPEPGKRVKDEYVDWADGRILRKRLTGMLFLFGAGRNLAIGQCLVNGNQVINFISNRFMQWRLDRGDLLCHAAAVSRNGRGLAIAAAAGSGKSTLALQLLARDVETLFVSNDRLLIRRENDALIMTGLPKLPRVNPGTILHNPRLVGMVPPRDRARYSALPADELWSLEEKYDVDLRRRFGPHRVRLVGPMDALVMLNWCRHGGLIHTTRADLRRRPDLLHALIKRPGVHYLSPGRPMPAPSDRAYLRCLGHCPVWEISGRIDFDAACSECLEILRRTPEFQDSRC